MKSAWALLALIVSPVSALAGPAETLASRFNQTLPTEFNQLQAQGFATTLTSCLAPAIGNMISNVADSCERVTLETKCTEFDLPEQDPDMACEALISGGKLNDRYIKSLSKQQTDIACSLKCRNAKLKLVASEVKCLGDQSSILAQQIGSVQQSFLTNINGYRTKMQEATAIERERMTQIGKTKELLEGKGAAQPGLLVMQAKLTAKLAEMKQQINGGQSGLRAQLKQITERKRFFKEQVASAKMARAVECFSKDQKMGSFKCSPNGPLVSALDYILCRYQQEQGVGARGMVSTNKDILAQAKSKRDELDNFLKRMLQTAPKTPNSSTNPQDAVQNAEASYGTVRTPKEMKDRFLAQLATRYDTRELNISKFTMSVIQSCYEEHAGTIEKQVGEASSQLGLTRQGIIDSELAVNSVIDTAMTDYAQIYTEAARALTGVDRPVSVELYRNAKPEVQLGFLTAMEKNMEAALRGTPGVRVAGFENAMTSDFKSILVSGANPALNINVDCQGINQCVTKLNNLDTNLKTEVTKIQEAKTKFVNQANANISSFAQSIAQNLQQQAGKLKGKVDALNAALSSVGADPSLKFDDVEGEELEGDESLGGLFKTPKSALNFIGSKMNPKMMNVTGAAFTTVGASIKTTQTELAQKLGRLSVQKNDLAAKSRSCLSAEQAKAEAAYQTALNELEALSCHEIVKNCGFGESRSQIDSLIAAINNFGSIGGEGLESEGVMNGLEDGISTACGESSVVIPLCQTKVAETYGGAAPADPGVCQSKPTPDQGACNGQKAEFYKFSAALTTCNTERLTAAGKCRAKFTSMKGKATAFGRSMQHRNPFESGDDDSDTGE